MKRAIWAAVLLTAGLSGGRAQESGKAVAGGGGAAPTSTVVWVAQRQANQVTIRTTGNPSNFIKTLAGPGYGFFQPWDIVHLASRNLVFVSNAGNGTVSVIDAASSLPVTIVDLSVAPLNGNTLGGMSVSANEDAVFVAGADGAGAAIFRISVPALTASRVGGKGGPPADDCAAIRAGASGGSGNATRKIYFSQRATNELSEINLAAGGALSTVTLGAGTLNEVSLPDNMDRTADHRFVFVACTKIAPTGDFAARTVRIDPSIEPLGAAVSQRANANGLTDDDHRVMDITFGTGPGGINRGFALVLFDPNATTTRVVVEIDETGAFVGGATPTATTGGVTPSTLHFMSATEQIFVGEVPGTSNQYNVFNAKFGSAITFQNTVASGASEPGHFALVPMSQPVITDMCPRGALAGAAAGSNIVTIHGAGFLPGATTGGAAAVPVGFIDSTQVTVDLSGGAAGTLGITITNPNNLAATIAPFYRRYTPEVLGASPITVPAATKGGRYQMFSAPQYLSLGAFKSALAGQFGPYNPVVYRVFFFRKDRYVELTTMKDDGCDLAGEAFWMISRDGGAVTFQGPDVRANSGGTDRVIPINPGFNMISVPMVGVAPPAGQINWAAVQVTTDPTDFTAGLQSAPAAAAILAPVALEFVNGSYVAADPLVTGRGYWVENITNQPAYLVFSVGSVNKPSLTPIAGGSPPPPGMKPPPPPSELGEGGSGCGFTGLEALIVLLAARGFPRSRRVRKLVA